MKAHNDHPLAMFDRTCPGCDEETQMTKIPPWEASLNRAIDALDDVIENVPERSVTRIKGAIVWIEQAIHEAKSLSPEGGAIEALKLAKQWIEMSEDQTMETALAVEARCNAAGKDGYNPNYIAACRAVTDVLNRCLPQRQESK